jgi:hypothetical protein
MSATAEDVTVTELGEGYQLHTRLATTTAHFHVMKGERRVIEIEVAAPLTERKYEHRWIGSKEWDPQYDPVECAKVEWARYGISKMLPRNAKAVATALVIAADYAERLNDEAAEALAYQERAKHEIEEVAKREAEEEEQRLEAIREQVQWYIGQTFKLKRKGYRATVYGTIDSVSTRKLHTTSERGVKMTTELLDLETMSIKYEGEKRYTKVFPA